MALFGLALEGLHFGRQLLVLLHQLSKSEFGKSFAFFELSFEVEVVFPQSSHFMFEF